MRVAGRAVVHNLVQLGPLVLPVREQLRYAVSWIARGLINKDWELYKPSFNTAFDHFCIHTGGRGMLDSMEKQLSLSPAHLQPSRETLKRYGNTSSSSIWYLIVTLSFSQSVESLTLSSVQTSHHTCGTFSHSLIPRFPIRRSGALQQTFYGSPVQYVT